MRRLIGICALLLMLMGRVFAADSPLTLTIYPRFSHGPGTIRATLVIKRDSRNREACIAIEGDTGYSRSSCWEHVGEGAAFQTVIYYPGLPPGSYVAQATVARVLVDGKREEVRSLVFEFRLLGFGEESEEP